jgi:hypothetical protein
MIIWRAFCAPMRPICGVRQLDLDLLADNGIRLQVTSPAQGDQVRPAVVIRDSQSLEGLDRQRFAVDVDAHAVGNAEALACGCLQGRLDRLDDQLTADSTLALHIVDDCQQFVVNSAHASPDWAPRRPLGLSP